MSTKTLPQISPSNFTTRFWVVAGPTSAFWLNYFAKSGVPVSHVVPQKKIIGNELSATRGLPLPLGREVLRDQIQKGRARDRKPFIHRVYSTQGGGGGIETMVSVHLVAQSSATGVTVAAIPPCSAIRFRNPKVPRYPPPAHRIPCLLPMRGKCDRGVRRKVRHLDFGGV